MACRRQLSLLHVALGVLTCFVSTSCYKRPTPPRAYFAFVANHDSNTVAVVDLGAFQVVATIPVAAGPQQLAVRPGSQEVWVVSDSGSLSVVQYPELRVTRTAPLGSSARNLAFSSDGRSYYILTSGPAGSTEVVFGDGETSKPLRKASCCGGSSYNFASLALSPDDRTLVAADPAANRLVFVDAKSHELLGSAEVGETPGPIVITLDSRKVFVADTGENKVSAVDVASRQLLSNIEISSKPTLLRLKPDGGELFAFSADSAQMTILDTVHDYVEQGYPTGDRPAAAVFRKDSSVMYVANAGDGSVAAFDAQNRLVLNSTHAGAQLDALALTPDERFLVVADGASSSVAILRADPNETDSKHNPYLAPNRSVLVATIRVGTKPLDVLIPVWESNR